MSGLDYEIEDVDGLRNHLRDKFNRLREHSRNKVRSGLNPAMISGDMVEMEKLAMQFYKLSLLEETRALRNEIKQLRDEQAVSRTPAIVKKTSQG